jgi:predicted O-linked N-acetylglucosamine transferase (SPINDLY family)
MGDLEQKSSTKFLTKEAQINFQTASSFHQKGQLEQARAHYLEVLKTQPNHSNSLYFLGIINCQTGNFQDAVGLIEKAISIDPQNEVFHVNLAALFTELKKPNLALESYNKAIELNPNNADYHYNRAIVLQNLKKFELALDAYDKAIALNSYDADCHYNRGNVLRELKQPDVALLSYKKSIQINHNHLESYINIANILTELKQFDLAISHYNKAIQLKPNCAETYYNMGNALFEIRNISAAINSYHKAIKLNPNYVEAYFNLGNSLIEAKQAGQALDNYKKVFQLKTDYKFLLGLLLHTQSKICDWQGYEESKEELMCKIKNNELVSSPFPVLTIIDSTELQYMAADLSVKNDFPEQDNLGPILKRPKCEKIRIGYYSSDFYNHATSYLMAGLFEGHNRSEFEIIAFSFGPNNGDEMQNRITKSFDKFIDVTSKSDIEVAILSRDMAIDIAVDLKSFTAGMRLGIFAHRCAPIQVNYLGYPGTMAASYIDYIIADKIIIPEENKKYYSEKIAYLPNSYQVNDSNRKISEKIFTREEFGLPKDGFVYCCFNNNYKITPKMFDIWMKILAETANQNSVLWLLEDNKDVSKNLKKEAEKRGVNSNRLIFSGRMLQEEHLARHKLADLFIDTFPCNAHTTCSDALWSGLPVLTLSGQSFTSRVAASLLNAIELPELITSTEEEYAIKAIEFATNLKTLIAIKAKLEKNKLSTALFDTKSFAIGIEKAYKAMYNRYQNDLLPDDIVI